MEAIQPEEIAVGDCLTVLYWNGKTDNSYKGDLLDVTGIDLPFVVVKGPQFYSRNLVLDVRLVTLAKPSEDFVKAARPVEEPVATEKVVESEDAQQEESEHQVA